MSCSADVLEPLFKFDCSAFQICSLACTLANEVDLDEEPQWQKIGRKRQSKTRRRRIELLELNTALVKAYRELDKMTCVAKDMVVSNKHAHKQAKTAKELWQASESHMAEIEQWLKAIGQTNPLPLPSLAPNHVDVSTQTEDTTESVPATAHHPVLPLETATVPPSQYKEEFAAQAVIIEKANERYHAAKEEADQIHVQAEKREVPLQQLLPTQTAKHSQALQDREVAELQAANAEWAAKLQETEENVVLALRAANEASIAKIHEIEEGYQRASAITNNQPTPDPLK